MEFSKILTNVWYFSDISMLALGAIVGSPLIPFRRSLGLAAIYRTSMQRDGDIRFHHDERMSYYSEVGRGF